MWPNHYTEELFLQNHGKNDIHSLIHEGLSPNRFILLLMKRCMFHSWWREVALQAQTHFSVHISASSLLAFSRSVSDSDLATRSQMQKIRFSCLLFRQKENTHPPGTAMPGTIPEAHIRNPDDKCVFYKRFHPCLPLSLTSLHPKKHGVDTTAYSLVFV